MFELIKIEIENSKNVLSHKIIRLIKKFRQLLNEVNSNVRKVIRMSVMSFRMTERFNYFFVCGNT